MSTAIEFKLVSNQQFKASRQTNIKMFIWNWKFICIEAIKSKVNGHYDENIDVAFLSMKINVVNVKIQVNTEFRFSYYISLFILQIQRQNICFTIEAGANMLFHVDICCCYNCWRCCSFTEKLFGFIKRSRFFAIDAKSDFHRDYFSRDYSIIISD